MKNRELIEKLGRMDPEAEVMTDFRNGHVPTYAVVDEVDECDSGNISSDVFGTPGWTDTRGIRPDTEKVILIGSSFSDTDKKGFCDQGLNGRLRHIASMHRSVAWKMVKAYEAVARAE